MYKSRLKFMREDKSLSQSELAEKSGVSLRTIQAYEHMHHEDMQELREEHQQAIDYLKKQIKTRCLLLTLFQIYLMRQKF